MWNQMGIEPKWAVLTVWVIVNAVNLLQGIGFVSRVATGSRSINHILGWGIIALSIPAILALIAFLKAGAGWFQWSGLVVFLGFNILMVLVDYLLVIEFRSPARLSILVPYLLLFFGSILLMGLPMFQINKLLWLVTVTTSVFLLGAMGYAQVKGVG